MSLTENYISIPKQLIVNLRDNPLAIALYFVIARLYLVRQQPVPLSRGDIQQFDPTARIGAIKRALDRLTQAGWLVETIGYKSSYTPIWGRRRGTQMPYQWNIGQLRLGCPKHIWTSAIRVDRAILDVFVGKFEPHERNPHIESYFTRPLLSLQDIGAYILTAAELPSNTTEALQRWSLVEDGQAQSIPDDTVVLALASQRASVTGFQLTPAGWRCLGWPGTCTSQPATPAGAEAAPLIFVPKERIGSLIPHVIGESIGCADLDDRPASPAESPQRASQHDAATIPGIPRNSSESRDIPPYPPVHIHGGGTALLDQQDRREIELPDTEAAQALFAFGVNDPTCLVELSTIPFEQVERAIAYAASEELGPGWVVTALRRHRDEDWPIPLVRRRRQQELIDWEAVAATHGDLFRHGSDLSGLDWKIADAVLPPGQLVQPGAAQAPAIREQQFARPPNTVSQPVPTCHSTAELTQELRVRLLAQCGRSYRPIIDRLQVRLADHTTVIHCATLADRMAVLDALMGALRYLVADLGLPTTIRVTDAAAPAEEQARVVGQSASGVPVSA